MKPPGRIVLEVAVAGVEDACVAQDHGADRLELSENLSVGGLTPPLRTTEAVRRASHLPLLVLIRPRAGGFVYSESEFAAMCRQADEALAAGVDGIVVGVLTPDRRIDVDRCARLRALAAGRTVVFHRAFDEAADPFVSLEQIIDLGFHRILTSGQRPTALEGSPTIRELIERSNGRIEILPGAGINRCNVREIIQSTAATQIHGTFRNSTVRIDVTEVRAVRAILDGLG